VQLPIVDELAEELKGRAALATVNVDAEGELDAQYGVNSVPTLILFNNGEIVDKMVGLTSKSDLKSKIISHLDKSNQTKLTLHRLVQMLGQNQKSSGYFVLRKREVLVLPSSVINRGDNLHFMYIRVLSLPIFLMER
jgi:thiol-disulfide isomerase/thioredoxin